MPNWADPLASVTIGQRARPNSPPTYALRMPPAYRSFIRNFFITPSAASIVRMYCVFWASSSRRCNSLKLYDKEGSILRVETTIVRVEEFRVYRPNSKGELTWQSLRRGVADLWRRAQVSEASNGRYLEALAAVTGTTPLYQEARSVCRPQLFKGRRYRALNPWSEQD